MPEAAGSKVDRAERERLRTVLERDPDDREALIALAALHAKARAHEDALALYRQAVQAAPGKTARLGMVEQLRLLRRYDEAERELAPLMKGRKTTADAHTEAALLLAARGDPEAALVHFRSAAGQRPGDFWTRLRLADALSAAGRPDEAIEALEALLVLRPDQARIHVRLGRLRLAAAPDWAAEAFRQALRLDPKTRPQIEEIADQRREAGLFGEAETAYAAVFVEHPDLTAAAIAAAECAERAGAPDRAMNIYAQAVSTRPDNVDLQIRLARAMIAAGDAASARALLEAHPDRAEALLALAELAEAEGDRDAARALLRRAETAAGDDFWAGRRVARAYETLGDLDAAASILETLVAARPGHSSTMMRLAELQRHRGRLDEAVGLLRRICALEPRQPYPWRLLGRLLSRTTGYHAVETAYGEALAEAGSRPHPAFPLRYADVLAARGKPQQADRVLEEALRTDGGARSLIEARIRHDIAAGRDQAVREGLDRLPPGSPEEESRKALLLARWRVSRWDEDEAYAAFRRAAELDEGSTPAFRGLTRVALWKLDIDTAQAHLRGERRARALDRPGVRVSNISQGLFGEIINDLRTDPQALADTRAAAGDLDALRQVVRDNPDYTGAALTLLRRLRLDGKLDWKAGPVISSAPIPRAIYQFWDKPDLPADLEDVAASWAETNPGWTYTRFDDGAARAWLEANADPEVARAFRSARHAARRADILRLAILVKQGGVYADADDRCLSSLDPLIEGAALVLRQEPFYSIGNNFIAARPGHPVIEAALGEAVDATLRGDSESVWLSTGPGAMSRAVARHCLSGAGTARHVDRSVRVFDDVGLRNFVTIHCRAAYKDTAQNWKRVEASQSGVQRGAIGSR